MNMYLIFLIIPACTLYMVYIQQHVMLVSPLQLTETRRWSRRATTGPAPRALSMSGVLCDRKIVTFGGVLSGKGHNSVHMLDTGRYIHKCIMVSCEQSA